MTRRIYTLLELDHERLGRFTTAEGGESQPGGFLDYLAGDDDRSHAAEIRELEAFLWQRQSHVRGRADR